MIRHSKKKTIKSLVSTIIILELFFLSVGVVRFLLLNGALISALAIIVRIALVSHEDEQKPPAPKYILPDEPEYECVDEEHPKTDTVFDDILEKRNLLSEKMFVLDEEIESEKVSAQIVHLRDVTQKISDKLNESPGKISQTVKFFDYYVPATIRLLEEYKRLEQSDAEQASRYRIEELLDVALAGYDKQLDSLYDNEAIDVSADISVFTAMLMQDGLVDDELQKLLNK